MALGDNDQFSLRVDSLPGQLEQPCTHVGWYAPAGVDVYPKLNRGRNLVYVLSAWTGRTHKLFVQLVIVNEQSR